MKIKEIEYTPNPNAVKFILDEPLTPFGIAGEFHNAEQAASVPFARALFEVEHVQSVYYTHTWVTITQDGDVSWHELLREVAIPIREAVVEDARIGESMLHQGEPIEGEGVGLDDPRIPEIQQILDEDILPFLQSDGGGLEIKGFVNNQLLIRYQGACGTCPASSMGTLMAIENAIQMQVDPDIEVVAI